MNRLMPSLKSLAKAILILGAFAGVVGGFIYIVTEHPYLWLVAIVLWAIYVVANLIDEIHDFSHPEERQ